MLPLDPPLTRGAEPGWINHDRMFSEGELEALREDPDDPDRQTEFARRLLERDPENLWAMAILARDAATDFEEIVLLREAVRVGLKLWAPALEARRPEPDWVRDKDARLFTGLVRAYGLALSGAGHRSEAAQCLAFLLRLDPEDSQDAICAFEVVGVVANASHRPS